VRKKKETEPSGHPKKREAMYHGSVGGGETGGKGNEGGEAKTESLRLCIGRGRLQNVKYQEAYAGTRAHQRRRETKIKPIGSPTRDRPHRKRRGRLREPEEGGADRGGLNEKFPGQKKTVFGLAGTGGKGKKGGGGLGENGRRKRGS